jgi:CspA family cold shock protein
MTGSIKTLNEKGFGFITPDDGGKDLFFHQSGLSGVSFDELKAGDKVSFDSEESEKGPRATNVQRA